jgi:hypothetical protein
MLTIAKNVYHVPYRNHHLGVNMTPAQFKNLQSQARDYMSSLDIDTVREEFSNSFLLNRNAKLEKGEGVANYGLELTPSKFASDANLCGGEGQCLFTCLVFSGAGNLTRAGKGNEGGMMILTPVLKKRLRRTFLFLNDQDFFLRRLEGEIFLLKMTHGELAIRLNVFSDIDWDSIFNVKGLQNQGVIFYDYTKKQSSFSGTRHLTYSASEKDSDEDLVALLERGFNVAMVFHANKLPQEWEGFPVVDGDKDDRRYLDSKGVVVGLVQKTTIGGKIESTFTRTVA